MPSLRRRLRHGAVTVVATSAVVAGGLALSGGSSDDAVAASSTAASAVTDEATGDLPTPSPAELARLAESRADSATSRSAGRAPVVDAKADLLAMEAEPGPQVTRTRTVDLGDPREIAQAMVAERGWSAGEFDCLDSLWVKESGWDPTAANPTSSAYGIPQALPGSKMASAGADWETNPATQIEWGLGYIAERYGTPCSAWGHSQANGWY